jgi:hypothetical protein
LVCQCLVNGSDAGCKKDIECCSGKCVNIGGIEFRCQI